MSIQDFEQLTNRLERARFLMEQPLTVHLDIVDLAPTYRAKAGEFFLPVTGDSKEGTLAKAKDWLQRILDEETTAQAEQPEGDATA